MSLSRPTTRFIGGSALVLVLLVVLFYRQHDNIPASRWRSSYKSPFQTPPPYSGGPARHPHPAEGVAQGDAHRILDADDFAQHVGVVLAEEPLQPSDTVRGCHFWLPDVMDKLQFQFGVGEMNPWTIQEQKPELVVWHRLAWTSFYKERLIPWSTTRELFAGRGIVLVIDDADSFMRVAVLLRQLTTLASELPVQIFYWATKLDQEARDHLGTLYHTLSFQDLADPAATVYHTPPAPPRHPYFSLKTAAVLNAKFAEVLLLDSDSLPLRRPDDLFDSDLYSEYGTIFWSDLTRTRPVNTIWAITNTFCLEDEYEIDSGQLMVDKRRFWYHIQLAAFFNEQEPYWKLMLGDKDTWRFAWHALKTDFGKAPHWLTAVGVTHPPDDAQSSEKTFCGHSYIQRAPSGEAAFLHGTLLQTLSPKVLNYFLNHGGAYNAFKRSVKGDNSTRYAEPAKFFYDNATFDPLIAGEPSWLCMDLPEIEALEAGDMPGGSYLDDLMLELGGWWVLEQGRMWEASEVVKEMVRQGTVGPAPVIAAPSPAGGSGSGGSVSGWLKGHLDGWRGGGRGGAGTPEAANVASGVDAAGQPVVEEDRWPDGAEGSAESSLRGSADLAGPQVHAAAADSDAATGGAGAGAAGAGGQAGSRGDRVAAEVPGRGQPGRAAGARAGMSDDADVS